jgi:hypothetical protein
MKLCASCAVVDASSAANESPLCWLRSQTCTCTYSKATVALPPAYRQLSNLIASLCCAFLQALVSIVAVVAVAAVLKCLFSRPSSRVYLVDFAVHKGLDEWKFSKDLFIPMSAQTGVSSWQHSCG